MMERYARQISLPEIGLMRQERLAKTHIVMVGAGGLGAAALPYLAGAGIGRITIIDHDAVNLHNLHRQTIYRTDQIGMSKAQCAAEYFKALNPTIEVTAITEKLTASSSLLDLFGQSMDHSDKPGDDRKVLILDGSDNFETKALLNDLAIATRFPLITASVNGFTGQIGIFTGHKGACYRCLFPEFPSDARTCNEAGILGTSAGIIGVYQAHLALSYALGLNSAQAGTFYTLDLKSLRIERIKIEKDSSCLHCNGTKRHMPDSKILERKTDMVEMISIEQLAETDSIIIDVRQPEELLADPLRHPAIHIPLPQLIARLGELPEGKRLAFLCAGNVRSRQAAEYLAARGYNNVCILDKFTL